MATDDGPVLSFNSISTAGQALASGTLRLSRAGFAWRAKGSTRNLSVASADLLRVEWLRGGRGHQLKLSLRGGSTLRLEGFRASDYSSIGEFVSDHLGGKTLTRVNQACRGWSWGELDVTSGAASNLIFRTGGGNNVRTKALQFEEAFEIPLGKVANVQLPGHAKELALDFHVDDTAGKMDEELVEMRFFIPEEKDAENVYEQVKARADTSAFAGESLCSFSHMGVAVPRGRYDVDMYANYIKLRGKAVDFKILYSSIIRLFLLPKPDNIIVSFVMSLDPPIRQGNTMYPHLVFQFDTEEKTRVDLPISAQDLQNKYKGKLNETENGYTWRVFSKVLKNLSATPLHVPKTFKSTEAGSGVRTALGANEGFLFFLETCCFFVNKPPTYIRYDDIDFVEFRRMDLERRFDLFIAMTTGTNQTHLFTNIERSEFEPIFSFLHETKKVPVEGAEQLKRTGGRQQMRMMDDDDDSESDDDDFDPNAQEKEAASESSSDSEDEMADEDDADSRPPRKKKKN
ncbi:Structure-specific recognition protein [Gracilaria domingensis]|nr:Structure-specific recognition protein [Gracilaria domingensis]